MSKPIKNLVTESYRRRFADVDGGVIVDLCGVASNDNNQLRDTLAEQGIRVTIVKNSLAKAAFSGTALEGLGDMLDGPCAIAYGGDSVVVVTRSLVDLVKQIENLEVKGALMEGQTFGAEQIDALSKYPTREEAQGQLISIVLGPAGQVIGAATSGGSAIASVLETLVEKLEKGETVSAS